MFYDLSLSLSHVNKVEDTSYDVIKNLIPFSVNTAATIVKMMTSRQFGKYLYIDRHTHAHVHAQKLAQSSLNTRVPENMTHTHTYNRTG